MIKIGLVDPVIAAVAMLTLTKMAAVALVLAREAVTATKVITIPTAVVPTVTSMFIKLAHIILTLALMKMSKKMKTSNLLITL